MLLVQVHHANQPLLMVATLVPSIATAIMSVEIGFRILDDIVIEAPKASSWMIQHGAIACSGNGQDVWRILSFVEDTVCDGRVVQRQG